MGKVGSTTIAETLSGSEEFCNEYDVYHVHWINKENIIRVSDSFSSKGLEVPVHLETSKRLLAEINFKEPEDLIIITSLRQVLPTYVSGFFQNIRRYIHNNPEIVKPDGSLNIDRVETIIYNNIHKRSKTAHYTEFWVHTEIEKILGIDFYSVPFNYVDKYLINGYRGVKMLIFRLEDLNSTLLQGLADLFESKYTFNITAVPLTVARMNFGCSPETSTRMDAGEEPPWMGLRRVSGEHPEFMSRVRRIF